MNFIEKAQTCGVSEYYVRQQKKPTNSSEINEGYSSLLMYQIFKEFYMHYYLSEEREKRKDSLVTDQQSSHRKENEIDNDLENEPQPQLKNMMSSLSNEEQPGIPRVVSFNQYIENQQDYGLQNLDLQHHVFQIQEQLTSADNPCTQLVEQRSKRMRKLQNYNVTNRKQPFQNDSDISSQSEGTNSTPCNCSKSNCLKLYCPCFHRNQTCTQLCKCVDCHNNEQFSELKDKALDRIKIKQQRQKHDDDLFDRTKVWGCRCQKSQCKKNYCECYIRNQKCTSSCRCKDCENKKRLPNQFRKKKKIETVQN